MRPKINTYSNITLIGTIVYINIQMYVKLIHEILEH